MVLKNKSLDQQFLALSGLKSNKAMTPKIIDASSYISPSLTNKKSVKQFNNKNGSNKLANGNVSPEIIHYQQSQPLKRFSPKWYHSTHYHNHSLMLQQQLPQSQLIRQQRNSPSRVSPTSGGYAGAKFSEPPSPNELPKPPTHWTNGPGPAEISVNSSGNNRCADISDHIKTLLKLRA